MSALTTQESFRKDNWETLLEQGRRIRALHEIISRPDLTFEEQIDEILRLGCRLLGTEIGKVGRQDPENNVSEFLNTVVMSDLPARRGIVIPLDKTFCQVTFSSPEAIAISHVAQSEYCDHPAAEFLGMQSYIGCSINVHGRKFGTVNFSNRTPVEKPFTEADKDLVNLMGSWISVMMERQLEAEELRMAKESAERANLAKSSFLANMSHEIRTPLTAIIGFTDAVLNNDQSAEERESALQIIRRSSDHLLSLINDVLDISKIEAGELDVEKASVDLLSLVREVESIVGGQATQKALDFTVDIEYPFPEKINSDALRLKQILLNLCNNAIKFTNEGTIRLVIQYGDSEQQLKLSVRDTGIGMTAEQLEKIFKPFVQADCSTTKIYGGTGLGLSLSRRLAELLGGSLDVQSEFGKGSTFVLSIPVDNTVSPEFRLVQKTPASNQQTTHSEPSVPLPSLHGDVLLADDSEMNQYLFKMYIERAGVSVTTVENGALAVEKAKQKAYDLILMDMLMPVMSGVDAVRELRAAGYTAPIVMLTASVTLEDKHLCKEAGSDDFLSKPIDKPKFYDVLSRYLSSKTE